MSRRQRFQAPARATVLPDRFARPPLDEWIEYRPWLAASAWPGIEVLNSARTDGMAVPRFAAQTRELLADGLHYEERIAAGIVATREGDWHDLFNALAWLRHPRIKAALNARQVAEIAYVGRTQRSRAQCALTHFDEAGAIVLLADPSLLDAWSAHDWHALFWRGRAAWGVRIAARVFGHALLEHALMPELLLVGKAVALIATPAQITAFAARDSAACARVEARVAELIASGACLADPQELRPLPLAGIPGWHEANRSEAFLREAPCFRPLRPGRRYPSAMQMR